MKRVISFLVFAAMLFGMMAGLAQAADSEEAALSNIQVYNGGQSLNCLAVNGRVQEFNYVYYEYISKDGSIKEIPTYCVNPTDPGVPQKVPVGSSIEYIIKERESDPKVMGIVANGYPTKGLGELGLHDKVEGYYATKIALWCYIIPGWNISGVTVNPAAADQVQAQRVLTAAKKIYDYGTGWTEVLSAGLTTSSDQAAATLTTIDGRQYKEQIFKVHSDTFVYNYSVDISFADPSSVPSGTRIVDLDNRDITTVKMEGSGSNFNGQFKVLYPLESVEGQSGSVQFTLHASSYQYGVFYASCAETDAYGTVQNYICDTDPTRPVDAEGISKYSDGDDDDGGGGGGGGGETALKIVKLEEGTKIPLEGAVFDVEGPDGNTIGSFSTGPDGTVTIPVEHIGSYVVTEITPPKHHLLTAAPTQTVSVSYGRIATVTFENAPYGNLRVEKVSNTGDQLTGVTVQVKHIESGTTYSAQTGPGGAAVFEKLKPGAYEVSELAGIEGWKADTDTVKTVSVVKGETATTTLTNKELPGLRILKYDRQTMTAMKNVTFEIYKDGTLFDTVSTNELGEIQLTNLQPGTYRVVEVHTGDAEHLVDLNDQEIELAAGDGIKKLVFFNDRKPGIHLVKIDSANPARAIPNAVFEIKGVDANFGPKEFTTGPDGTIDLSALDPGAYVVTEKKCPGYVIDESQRIIHLVPNQTAEFVFTNSKLPSLRLLKTSSDGLPLKGVSFRLAKIEDGSHYLDRTTSATGEILWEGLEPGVYSLVETATLNNHIISLKEHHVELFPGKVSEIVLENHKRPNLIVYKNDADSGEPIKDTVFVVKAADGHSVDEIKTGPDGKAELKNLLPGVYEISEKSVPSPWLKDAPAQLVTLYPDRDHTAYFKNHKRPVIEIVKENAVTFEPLANVPFRVWYASNYTSTGEFNDLGTFYTDEEGRIVLNGPEMGEQGLRDGWFRVQELEPLKGFAKADPDTQEAFVPAGQSHTFRFRNNPLSAICVWKYDSQNPNMAIEGAVFQIRYLSGNTSGTGGTVIGTWQTSQNGSFTATGLKKGAYIIEELSSDGSHVIDTPPQTVYLSGEEQEVIQVYFGNSPKGSLLVKKVSASDGAPLSDVEFLVTASDGTVVGNANGKFVTRMDGTFLVDNIDPNTTLVVKETRAKPGYLLDDVPQTAQVKAGQTVTLEFRNQKKGNLVIHKLSGADKSTPLPGAQFKITYADGTAVDAEDGKLSSNGLYQTNAEGQIVLSGVVGTLICTEVSSAPGYAIDPNTRSQTVVIHPGDDTQSRYFYNNPLCSLTISKVDSTNGKPVPDTQFSVKYASGEVIGTYTTGKDGTVTVSGLLPNSTVIVTETKVPDTHVLDTTPHVVTLKAGKNTVTSGVTGGGSGNDLTVENDPKMTLTIRKYIKGTAREPLAGVCFKVTEGSGAPVGSGDGTFYTNSAGEIVIEGLEPGITVTAREISTVDGFVLDGTPQTVTIKAGKKAPELVFWNQKAGELVIRKLDKLTGKPLAGVEFELTYAGGGYVDDANGHLSSKGLYTTNANGEIRITGVTGTIVAKEIRTIPGYTIDPGTQTQSITVNPADTQTLTFYNTPGTTLTIQKYIEGTTTPIPGVTFLVTDSSGAVLGPNNGEYVTDRNGRIVISGLVPGVTITAKEIRTAEGFVLNSTPQSILIKEGEAQTMTFYNKAEGGLELIKVSASDKTKRIPNTTFEIHKKDGGLVDTVTTGKNGAVHVDLDAGDFYAVEIEAAQGFKLDDTPQYFTI